MRKTLILLLSICSLAAAQDLPRIAVYVTGDVADNEKRAMGTRMLSSLINSGRYRGIERSGAFLAEIEREQTRQRSGAIDDNQISELGRQFGVRYICITDIIPAFGAFQVSARIVDVETAEVVFIGESYSYLRTISDMTQVSDEVVQIMFGEQVTHRAEPRLVETPPPVVAAVQITEGGVPRGVDFYIALRWLPVAPPAFGFDGISAQLETGGVWRNGRFFGVDLGVGGNAQSAREMIGISLNFGDTYELTPGLELVYGGSAGLWQIAPDEDGNNTYILGPFTRLRLKNIEFSNRVLIGNGILYQAGIGLYFEGSRRHRR
jgi:hypothetical protein